MKENEKITPGKILLLGMGNPDLSDDGVGIYLLRALEERLNGAADITFIECSLGGMSLLDVVLGYDTLIIIDSVITGKMAVGEAAELDLDSIKGSIHISNVHGINLATALELGRIAELEVPHNIKVFAVEVQDIFTFQEQCTPKVQAALPEILNEIEKEIREYLDL